MYALWLASKKGHEITDIVAMIPKKENSWMFHRPNPQIIELLAEATQLPLIKGSTSGIKGRELGDLKSTLEGLSIEGVVSGAVASNYQKNRIERICDILGISCLTPLWKKDPVSLLQKMLDERFKIIITSVSAQGFEKEWLGRKIDEKCLEALKTLKERFGINLAGEGGEYETLVLDAPLFKKKILPIETERIWRENRGHLKIKEVKLVPK